MSHWLEQRRRGSNYNDRYKNSTLIGMPDYLLKRRERERESEDNCEMEMRRRGRKEWILEDKGDVKCVAEEGCIEHIMSHRRIKIRIGKVLDVRGKGEVKWMKEVKRLRKVHMKGIERMRECEYG